MIISIVALGLKLVLQLVSAFPLIAAMAHLYRNFVIAYLHLVLLGFISVFAFAAIFKSYRIKQNFGLTIGVLLFFFSFVITESLLVLQALGGQLSFTLPNYTRVLLMCSIPFPISILMLCCCLRWQIKLTEGINHKDSNLSFYKQNPNKRSQITNSK